MATTQPLPTYTTTQIALQSALRLAATNRWAMTVAAGLSLPGLMLVTELPKLAAPFLIAVALLLVIDRVSVNAKLSPLVSQADSRAFNLALRRLFWRAPGYADECGPQVRYQLACAEISTGAEREAHLATASRKMQEAIAYSARC